MYTAASDRSSPMLAATWRRRVAAALIAASVLFAEHARADIDNGLTKLTDETMQLDQAARALEDSAAPSAGTTDIYLGDRVDGLLLRYVHAQVDDGAPLQYEYSEAEALSLTQGALHPLFTLPLTPGLHRLRIEYTARNAQGLPGDPPVRGWLDQKFESSTSARWQTAELQSQGYVGKSPQMKLRGLSVASAASIAAMNNADARAGLFSIGSDDDPRVRMTSFLLAEDRPFVAASELLYLQAHSPVALPDSFAARLAAIEAELDSQVRFAASSSAPDPLDGKPANSLQWAARDRANLNLGYEQLHQGQTAAAIASFGRVRAQGPFSAPALLGLGWAYLAGGDASDTAAHASRVSLQPDFIGAVERRQRRGALHTTQPSSAQLQALRSALVPWTELIGRDPMEPAVQEGLLAIAYALDHSNAFEDAQRFYLRSVKLEETTRARLDSAIAQINNGGMMAAIEHGAGSRSEGGWHWQLPDVPADAHWWLTLNDDPQAPDDFYFEQLLAVPDFNAGLRDYRRLQGLIAACDAHTQALAQNADASAPALQQRLRALRPRLLAVGDTFAARLQNLALADLQRQQRQAEAYWVEARFALARSNDWAPAEAPKK